MLKAHNIEPKRKKGCLKKDRYMVSDHRPIVVLKAYCSVQLCWSCCMTHWKFTSEGKCSCRMNHIIHGHLIGARSLLIPLMSKSSWRNFVLCSNPIGSMVTLCYHCHGCCQTMSFAFHQNFHNLCLFTCIHRTTIYPQYLFITAF